MIKRFLTLFLILILLSASGCTAASSTDNDLNPTIYDWMAGESPISARRTGLDRQCVALDGFECTNDGVYFLFEDTYGNGYLLYGDHGSDTLIKLCGRPDCPHDNATCNAYLRGYDQLRYYDGHLYAAAYMGNDILIRMDLDGSNRETVLKYSDIPTATGGGGIAWPILTNGVYAVHTNIIDPDGNGHGDGYYYLLDGSMAAPEALVGGVPFFSDGEAYVVLTSAQNGGEYNGYASWDPATNTTTYLSDRSRHPGYYSQTNAYYHRDGALIKLDYATGQEEVLLETRLTGSYAANVYPDCIVIASTEKDDPNLYIYNWAFEQVGQVTLTYPHSISADMCILAETAERLILSDSIISPPRYYIEKSDFGTGNIEIHEYNIPDLEEELAAIDAELEAQRKAAEEEANK